MNAKLTLAISAALLTAAPAAMAQVNSRTMSETRYEYDSPSGMPSVSPQVQSLPGQHNNSWSQPQHGSTMGGAHSGMAGSTYGNSATYGGASGYSGSSGHGGSTNHGGTAGMSGGMDGGGAPAYSGSTGTAPGMTSGMGQGGTTSNSGAMGMTGGAFSGMVEDRPEVRRGPGQNPTELMQTTLLNQFSAAGFVQVRDFRKQGQSYIAQAMTPAGDWSTVQLDPTTGRIEVMR